MYISTEEYSIAVLQTDIRHQQVYSSVSAILSTYAIFIYSSYYSNIYMRRLRVDGGGIVIIYNIMLNIWGHANYILLSKLE